MLDFEKKAFESQYKDYKRRYLEADEAYQKAKNAAIEPMTCSDGQTFVFVSNT